MAINMIPEHVESISAKRLVINSITTLRQ